MRDMLKFYISSRSVFLFVYGMTLCFEYAIR